jgi:hypothetical protein
VRFIQEVDMSDHAGGTSELRQVRATFANPDQMQDAVGRLSMLGFDRAEMSVPSENVASGHEGSLAEASKPASTDEDARQARVLGASTAGSAAALAAAGITIATGGAAAPAVAAAVLAGTAAGGGTFAVHQAADKNEQDNREAQAAAGDLVLLVHAKSAEKQQQAESILRAAGAINIETTS